MPGFEPANVEEASEDLVGDAEASVMTADSVDERPQPVRRVDPELPRRIVDEQIEGRVVVRALIDENGRVSEVEIIEADPPDTFEPHVLEAV
jgi:protein TonB